MAACEWRLRRSVVCTKAMIGGEAAIRPLTTAGIPISASGLFLGRADTECQAPCPAERVANKATRPAPRCCKVELASIRGFPLEFADRLLADKPAMLRDIARCTQIHDELPSVVFILVRRSLDRGNGAIEKGFSVLRHIPTPVISRVCHGFLQLCRQSVSNRHFSTASWWSSGSPIADGP